MKKKIYSFGVAIAALAAFVGCSSENDLTQVGQDDVVKATSPFTFNVTMDDGNSSTASSAPKMDLDFTEVTRATTVSSNPFTEDGAGFTLYGFQAGKGMFFEDGAAFSYDADASKWDSGGANWPTNSPLEKCYFYALSYAGKDATELAATNVTSDPYGSANDAVSFGYSFPVDAETGAFDLDKQEDLLVASDLTGKKSGDVDLTFSHALANLEIKAIMPTEKRVEEGTGYKYESAESVAPFGKDCVMYIKSITIHNLPTSGTYTYGATTPWAPGTSKGDVVITWPTGFYLEPVSFVDAGLDADEEDGTRIPKERNLYKEIATGDASIMMIPHSYSVCDANFSSEESAIFIEVNYCVAQVTTEEDPADFTDNGQFTIIKQLFADMQGSDDWNFNSTSTDPVTDKIDELVATSGKPYENWQVSGWLGDNVPVLTDDGGFYCGNASTLDKDSHYIKFKASGSFKPNKKYTLYIDFSNLLLNNGSNPFGIAS